MIIPVGKVPVYIPHFSRHRDYQDVPIEVPAHSSLCGIISIFIGVLSACALFYFLREEASDFVSALLMGILSAIVGAFMFVFSLIICSCILALQ